MCPHKMLLTRNCTAKSESKLIIKLADDTSVAGLISKSNEAPNREEEVEFVRWSENDNLSPKAAKTKEMVVDH